MRKCLKVPILLFLSVFLLSAMSMATTFTIDDVYNEFPGINTTMVGQDHNGVPYIESAKITIEAGFLTKVEIIGSEFENSLFNTYPYWDSLFINNDDGSTIGSVADGSGLQVWDNWDFYVKTDTSRNPSMYSVPDSGWVYTLASEANYRYSHPNGLSGYEANGLSVSYARTSGGVTYTFGDSVIPYIDGLIIGYTPFCANEVFIGSVPEPSNMFLVGTGLLGLVAVGRKRNFK